MLIKYPNKKRIKRNIVRKFFTGKITSPKPSIAFRTVLHGLISDSGINIGKANKSGTASPFVPKPNATCSITEGFLDGVEDEPVDGAVVVLLVEVDDC